MGLDVFWVMPPEVKPPVFNPPLKLRSGFTLDNGTYSFGDYSVILYELSGVPIHKREISSCDVEIISDHFDRTSRRAFFASNSYSPIPAQEWNDLKRMFKAYSKLGASMRVSY